MIGQNLLPAKGLVKVRGPLRGAPLYSSDNHHSPCALRSMGGAHSSNVWSDLSTNYIICKHVDIFKQHSFSKKKKIL
jgi:hypothetical protein